MRAALMQGLSALTLILGVALLPSVPFRAEMPYPPPPAQGDPYDYASYLFAGDGDPLPASFNLVETWWLTDYRAINPQVSYNPQEFYGVRGMGANRAWEVSTGRPDVVIAIVDSGIRWNLDADCQLLRKYFLNRFELPLPEGGPNPLDRRFGGYDVNGDGAFNIEDYWGDPAMRDVNGNGWTDPEDLILLFSDGVDGDGNGYTDDISGWDFFEGDNDPQDDVAFGHGSSQANQATAEAPLPGELCPAGDGYGFSRTPGTCPTCTVLPLRYSDSFVGDVNHFAEAVIYATDLGARVVEVAAGTFNHTSFGQRAVDYARARGVVVNASEADEAAAHHNWPAAYDGALVHNSVRPADGLLFPNSYLYLNGCTNFGSYAFVAVPSASCSSQATGLASGVSGLLVSAALNAVERGSMTSYLRDDGTPAPFPLSASEMEQLWRLAADDIDFSTFYPNHAFSDLWPEYRPAWWSGDPDGGWNNYALDLAILPTRRYQTVRGWDYFTGYGRINAARLLRFIGIEESGGASVEFLPGAGPYGVGEDALLSAQDRIPPEAEIFTPRRWRQYGFREGGTLLLPDDPASPTEIVVTGRAAANRVTAEGGTFELIVEWAPGAQGAPSPAGLAQAAPGSGETSAGPWTIAAHRSGLTAAFEGELARIPLADIAAAVLTNPDPFEAEGDPTGPGIPERWAARIRLRVIAHPANPADTVNNEAVQQKPVDAYPAAEAFLLSGLGNGGRDCGGAGSPSFHDIDGDGRDELLLPTDDGLIHAFTDVATRTELPGWPVRTFPLPTIPTGGTNAYTRGDVAPPIFSSLQLGTVAATDLDDDGAPEVLAADMDGRIYAWEPDGSMRPGFPVTVDYALSREPACGPGTIPDCDDFSAHDLRDPQNQRDWALFSAPSVGDIDPSVPGMEILASCADGHIYAWHADGMPVAGWPVILRDPAKVATMDATTRRFSLAAGSGWEPGSKALATPSLGDLDGDARLEVVATVNEEYRETPNALFDPLLQQLIGPAGGGGNGRIYALRAEGASTPETAATHATAHTQDQAYLHGWPVPIAAAVLDILPLAGQGGITQPPLMDADGDGTLEVATSTHFGPAYLLDGNGSSHLGLSGTVYRTLPQSASDFGADSPASDAPSLPAFAALSAGRLAPESAPTLASGCAGLNRLLDIALPARQEDAEDHVGIWNTGEGTYRRFGPAVVNDVQFFAGPVFADVTGDGAAEIIQGTAFGDLTVVGTDSTVRYHTGGWHMGSAAVGRAPGAAGDPPVLHLASFTREGFLRLFPTATATAGDAALAAFAQWPEAGHDARNSGNLSTDAERPYPVSDLRAAPLFMAAQLHFIATGDDRDLGKAERYEVRALEGLPAHPSWAEGRNLEIPSVLPAPAGTPESFAVGRLSPGIFTLMVRAYDEAGNGSALAAVAVEILAAGFPGDCDGDGVVSIGEVQRAINMFLGIAPPDCGVDSDGDGVVSIGDVQRVINAFLGV